MIPSALLLLVAVQQPVQTVTGLVRNQANAPIPGASVQLGERSTTTNAQGVFQVDSIRPGRYALAVRAVGYLPHRTTIVVATGVSPRFEYVLQAAPLSLPNIIVEANRTGIYGVVGDSGLRALPGARVEVAGPGGGETRTDSAGRFAFPKAHNGQFAVRVKLEGFGEGRVWLSLKKNEGRELSIRLVPAIGVASRADDEAFTSLTQRLSYNLSRERMNGEELKRYGSLGLCDVNQIVQELTQTNRATKNFRMSDQKVFLVLNGQTVIDSFPIYAICAWRADEVELVEFGASLCRDASRTIQDLARVWCSGLPRRRPVYGSPRSITSAPGIRTQGNPDLVPFVVIWERR